MTSSWIGYVGRISAWLNENFGFFTNTKFLSQSYFFLSILYYRDLKSHWILCATLLDSITVTTLLCMKYITTLIVIYVHSMSACCRTAAISLKMYVTVNTYWCYYKQVYLWLNIIIICLWLGDKHMCATLALYKRRNLFHT